MSYLKRLRMISTEEWFWRYALHLYLVFIGGSFVQVVVWWLNGDHFPWRSTLVWVIGFVHGGFATLRLRRWLATRIHSRTLAD